MSNIKILWFSLTPCGSVRRTIGNFVRGGWMISLEDAIKKYEKEISLAVCYVSSIDKEPYEYDGVLYYPLYERAFIKNPIRRVLNRYQSNAKKEQYLLPLMIKAIEYIKPDLIHIHGTEERFGLIADYIQNIPIAYSIQGLIAPYKEKFWSGIPLHIVSKNETYMRKIRHITYECHYKDFTERARRELHYLANAKYILGRTFWDRRIPLLCNPKMKYYQAEELLRSDFYQKQWGVPKNNDNVFRIVTTLSGALYKGHETVLMAASLLKKFAKFEFEWLIIGCKVDEPVLKLAEWYKDIYVKDCNVRPLGFLTADDLCTILFSANVYCQVSHIENSPNSLCEALLLGMPCIASFVGGTATLTKGDESEALLYQDGDPYVLAGSIVDVHDNYEKAVCMGKKARQTALVRHNPKRVAEAYCQIYKNILDDFHGNKC